MINSENKRVGDSHHFILHICKISLFNQKALATPPVYFLPSAQTRPQSDTWSVSCLCCSVSHCALSIYNFITCVCVRVCGDFYMVWSNKQLSCFHIRQWSNNPFSTLSLSNLSCLTFKLVNEFNEKENNFIKKRTPPYCLRGDILCTVQPIKPRGRPWKTDRPSDIPHQPGTRSAFTVTVILLLRSGCRILCGNCAVNRPRTFWKCVANMHLKVRT